MRRYSIIIQEVARKNGVSPEAVERDIREALEAAKESSDPVAQVFWASLTLREEEPDPETILEAAAKRARLRMDRP